MLEVCWKSLGRKLMHLTDIREKKGEKKQKGKPLFCSAPYGTNDVMGRKRLPSEVLCFAEVPNLL